MEHIKELPNVLPMDANVPDEPIIFLKSSGSLLLPKGQQPQPLPLPSQWSSNVHHEVELALLLGPDLQPTHATVAIDMTARDVQVHQ
jgi:2-keto-4-pentenoate hydratase/2-oxohepta-3-ene-1,7-dioic acid hydratase in catechol pathway